MLDPSLITIALPFIAGSIVLLVPERWRGVHEAVSVVVSFVTFILTLVCFTKIPLFWLYRGTTILRIDPLAGFVGLFIGLFGLLITLYSTSFMKGREKLNQFYGYILWTLGGSIGAVYSNNLLLLLTLWGFLGLTFYMLISLGGPRSTYAAKKTFIIVGGSDAVMLLGVVILWNHMHMLNMEIIRIDLHLNTSLAVAFICLAIGAFAKAGAMPLHTWIPESSEAAPLPVVAFLPASLDKLLGIYLLARLTLDMFIIRPNSAISLLLLVIGAITIIAAVMMALVQHNLKRLLGYHAVSQVGYMVMGIGTAHPLGIAGGLFHMVNNALYKSCLFLSGGSVEKRTGTAELDELGGLSRLMPITFISCLIASLSISGVPPFNGFFSKWMIYQALVELGKTGMKTWVLWLVVAMFGSALTLASFMKLIYSVFLAPRKERTMHYALRTTKDEVPVSMWLPQVVLASLCVLFGVLAYQIPLKFFISPSIKEGLASVYPGIWNAPLATMLLVAGLLLGLLFFMIGRAMPTRRDTIFVGGEILDDNSGIQGTSFYNTIKDMPVLGATYRLAQDKVFDIYDQARNVISYFTKLLQYLHNGVLPTYVVWCLLGMIGMFLIMFR